MLDFTSALYLGLHHPGSSLRPWKSLTTGRPAVLGELPEAEDVAARLAALMGCRTAVMLPSTLHLFWDLFVALAEEDMAIHVDEKTYPIPRWGTERAAALGIPLRPFRHHAADALLSCVQRDAMRGLRPVVVTDGFCPACGKLAPLPDYLDIVRRYGGLLVLDDTQSLGILGHSPRPEMPYGTGGGGALRYFGLRGPDILSGCSLAKGFGVPVAVLAASARHIDRFKQKSDTRTHCSPASAAVIDAAGNALDVNAAQGDYLRLALVERVARFRSAAQAKGLATTGGCFPVQILEQDGLIDYPKLYWGLLRSGVRSVLLRGHGEGAIGFLINATHRPQEIECAVERLASNLAGSPHPIKPGLRNPKEGPRGHTLRI
jgi:8-amino-7-oxononanoate synthase